MNYTEYVPRMSHFFHKSRNTCHLGLILMYSIAVEHTIIYRMVCSIRIYSIANYCVKKTDWNASDNVNTQYLSTYQICHNWWMRPWIYDQNTSFHVMSVLFLTRCFVQKIFVNKSEETTFLSKGTSAPHWTLRFEFSR